MTKPEAPRETPVLVVDEDDLVRWSVARRLEEQGYPVVVATSGREAFERCPSARVVVLDGGLSGGDGLAVASALIRRRCRCTVVLTTADPTPELRRRAREIGVAGVLARPFSLDTLLAMIRLVLGRGATAADLPPDPTAPAPETRSLPDETTRSHRH